MLVYNYSEITKEYIGCEKPLKNPLEENGYLIPANATDIPPPTTGEFEVACFDGDKWQLRTDFRGNPQINLKNMEISLIDYIGLIKKDYQLLTVELANDIVDNPAKYDIVNGEVTDISNTEKYAQRQESAWKEKFIQTQLGWLRIQTKMGDLLSLLNSFEIVARIKGSVPYDSLIFYRTPDFSQELTDEYVEGLQFFNEEISYKDFMVLFDEVANCYLEIFKRG